MVNAFQTPLSNVVGLVIVRQKSRLCFRDVLKAVSACSVRFALGVELHEEKLLAVEATVYAS